MPPSTVPAFRLSLTIGVLLTLSLGAAHAQGRLAFRRMVALGDEHRETSGLIYWQQALWSINDSGDTTALYAIDPHSGLTLRRVIVTGIRNRDWESLAQDSSYIYIADVGNNRGNRMDLVIHRVLKRDLLDPSLGDQVPAQLPIQFSYPQQREFGVRKDHNWDAEALYAAGDSLYLCTKERGSRHTRWYSLPKQAGTYKAQALMQLDVDALVTGADYNEALDILALVDYTPRKLHLWLIKGNPARQVDASALPLKHWRLGRLLWKGQLESVCWQPSTGILYLTTEATPNRRAGLYRMDVSRHLQF